MMNKQDRIAAERDEAAKVLQGFLVELGYV
jgi:hypothetical protein